MATIVLRFRAGITCDDGMPTTPLLTVTVSGEISGAIVTATGIRRWEWNDSHGAFEGTEGDVTRANVATIATSLRALGHHVAVMT